MGEYTKEELLEMLAERFASDKTGVHNGTVLEFLVDLIESVVAMIDDNDDDNDDQGES